MTSLKQYFGSALVSVRIRTQYFRSMWIRIYIEGFDDKKFEKCSDLKSWIKTCYLLIPTLHKGRPNFRRSPDQRSTSKLEISFLFPILLVIFALLDPDPNSQCGSESGSSRQKSMRILNSTLKASKVKIMDKSHKMKQFKMLRRVRKE